jgi:hypothetical protein
VEDGGESAEFVGGLLDAIQEFISGNVILKSEWAKIAPFLILAESVGYDDLLDATLVEGVNESTADKSTRAGDKYASFLMKKDITGVLFFFTTKA